VVAALTEELADMVGNVLDEEPTQESYAKLKAALVATSTLLPYQMVDKLMAMEPLGGWKATELLMAIQKLRPPSDGQFFAWAFPQRLPHELWVLLAHDDHTNMRKLAENSDGLLALHQLQVHDLQSVAVTCAAGGSTPPAALKDDLAVAATAGRNSHTGKKKKKKWSGKPRRRSRSPAGLLVAPLPLPREI
jgi:hypothetical protein